MVKNEGRVNAIKKERKTPWSGRCSEKKRKETKQKTKKPQKEKKKKTRLAGRN